MLSSGNNDDDDDDDEDDDDDDDNDNDGGGDNGGDGSTWMLIPASLNINIFCSRRFLRISSSMDDAGENVKI